MIQQQICVYLAMSDRDAKVEDDPRDIHDEGGDDEVRAGSFQDAPI